MADELSLSFPAGLVEVIAERAAELVLSRLGRASGGESPFLTVPEAAVFARCKRQRIDDLLSARRLTRYKDGGRTLILTERARGALAGDQRSGCQAMSSACDRQLCPRAAWDERPSRASVGHVTNATRLS